MRPRSIFGVLCGVVLLSGVIYTASLEDATIGIRKLYPSAHVGIHESHSPDLRPILDLMRLIRGPSFIPQSEWISVYLENEKTPFTLSSLQRFHIASLQLFRCPVKDIAGLSPGMFAEFVSCDLSALPPGQSSMLWTQAEQPHVFLFVAP